MVNYQKEQVRIVNFIRLTLKNNGFNNIVIALSGGIDSTTVLYLAIKALRKENIYVMTSPYGDYDKQGLKDIGLILKNLYISKNNILINNIKKKADEIFKADPTMDNIRKGNIMARVRMLLLYDYAKKIKGLVVGTENKSEYLLGYYTRFGDEASDLEPIRHLYKTQVRQLAKYLGISKQIIQKKPTAGLWQGQTDEQELGFSYKQADPILQLYTDQKLTPEKIIQKGFSKVVVDRVIKRVKDNQFKHEAPYHL